MILYYILNIFSLIVWAYDGIICIDIILSWIPNARQYKIPSIIHTVSNWFMEPFNGIITIGFLDLSPLIGFAILNGISMFCFYFN